MSSVRSRDIEALRHAITELGARVAALEAGRGPRDAQDQALVLAIAVSTRGLDFTGAALWRHRDVDSKLAEALDEADIDNSRQLGKLLARCAGRDVGGCRVERVGADREGIRWRLRVCEFDSPERKGHTLSDYANA